jgi:hypothetical protein
MSIFPGHAIWIPSATYKHAIESSASWGMSLRVGETAAGLIIPEPSFRNPKLR